MKRIPVGWIGFLLLIVTFFMPTTYLYSANITWSGATNLQWTTPGNWVGGVVPGDADVAIFATPTAGTIVLPAGVTSVGTLNSSALTSFTIGDANSQLSLKLPVIMQMGQSQVGCGIILPAVGTATITTSADSTLSLNGAVSGTTAGLICNNVGGGISGEVNFNTTSTFSGPFSVGPDTEVLVTTSLTNVGDITINADGLFTLDPYTGRTVSISTQSIGGGGTLQYAGAATHRYGGEIKDAIILLVGDVQTTLILLPTATLTYTGATTLTGGCTLDLRSTIANSTVTVPAFATLTGNGAVTNTVNNSGTVVPGISASSNLRIGTYTETGNTTLKINLAPSSSPRLIATTATLNGTLLLSLETGIYTKGLTYRVLTATNPINNDFSNFKVVHADTGVPEVGSWSRQTVGGNVIQVTVLGHHVVTPTALEALQGNDRTIAHYMFDTPGLLLASPDLTAVANQMLALDGTAFKSALVRVSPLPYAANPQVGLQNNIQMAVILDKQYKEQVEKSRIQTHSDPDATNGPPLFADPQTGFFIEPIGMYIDQRQTGGSLSDVGQVPFEAFTYGAGIGYEKVLQDKFVVEAGVGYTHSNLNWRQDFGHARWSTVYIAPFFGWFDKVAYGNGMIMGGFNFHNTSRNILFNGFNRTATSSYATYDILLRVNGGVRGYLGNDWWIQPDGTLNYLTIFTPQYSEKGAGSINLVVRSRSSFIMQPSFRAYFIRELFRGDLYYAPKLYIGWLANILLNKDNVEARFEGAPSRIFFTIQGFTKTINQLVLGAEMYALKHEKYNFTASFEADLLQKLSVYTLKAKYEWMF